MVVGEECSPVGEGGSGATGCECGVPLVPGGPVVAFVPVSREVMERELARWKGVLDRLGNVDAGCADAGSVDAASR